MKGFGSKMRTRKCPILPTARPFWPLAMQQYRLTRSLRWVLVFAITSACQAAAIVQAELSTPDPQRIAVYQADLERHFTQYQTLRKKIYGEERRWPLSAFWQRRQGHGQVGALSL